MGLGVRFCVCWSHIYFSIKSLNFSVSVSDFKMPVSASLGFTIHHPFFSDRDSNLIFTSNNHYHEILGPVQWLVFVIKYCNIVSAMFRVLRQSQNHYRKSYNPGCLIIQYYLISVAGLMFNWQYTVNWRYTDTG